MKIGFTETLTTEEMFTQMLASVGITSKAGISDEVETALLEDTAEFAVEKGYFFDTDREIYVSTDTTVGQSWIR